MNETLFSTFVEARALLAAWRDNYNRVRPHSALDLPPCISSRKLKSIDVIDFPAERFIVRGVPGHIHSDSGPEFIAEAVREWIAAVGSKTASIAPGSPWENGYVESFNARLRDELLRSSCRQRLHGHLRGLRPLRRPRSI